MFVALFAQLICDPGVSINRFNSRTLLLADFIKKMSKLGTFDEKNHYNYKKLPHFRKKLNIAYL